MNKAERMAMMIKAFRKFKNFKFNKMFKPKKKFSNFKSEEESIKEGLCFNCKKPGHLSEDCHQKKEMEGNKGNKKWYKRKDEKRVMMVAAVVAWGDSNVDSEEESEQEMYAQDHA
ncbi:hypothetical protein Droror1_Dr00017310 [Drosera rotundifolia]